MFVISNLRLLLRSATTSTFGQDLTVTFTKWPKYPAENNLHFHSGNPTLSQMSCDITKATGSSPTCTIRPLATLSPPT